jgi:hypothetical protein
MWATADESSADLIDLYKRVWEHSDETIDGLDLDSPGRVPWWPKNPDTTLGRILVHMIVETQRHVGHADIVRELIDGQAGLRSNNSNLAEGDPAWWTEYYGQVEASAQKFRDRPAGSRAEQQVDV